MTLGSTLSTLSACSPKMSFSVAESVSGGFAAGASEIGTLWWSCRGLYPGEVWEPWADWKDCTILWRHGKSWESLSIPYCLWLVHEALKIFPESSTTRLVQAEAAIGTGTIPLEQGLFLADPWMLKDSERHQNWGSEQEESLWMENISEQQHSLLHERTGSQCDILGNAYLQNFAKWQMTLYTLHIQIMNFNLNVLNAISSFYQQTGVGLSAFQVNLRLGYPADSVEDGTCADISTKIDASKSFTRICSCIHFYSRTTSIMQLTLIVFWWFSWVSVRVCSMNFSILFLSHQDCNQLLDLDPRCAQASALRGEVLDSDSWNQSEFHMFHIHLKIKPWESLVSHGIPFLEWLHFVLLE